MNRLQKAREYKKRRISEETEIERKIRLKKSNESQSQRQIRLQKKKASPERKNLEETPSQRQTRLEKDNALHKRKRSDATETKTKRQKTNKVVSQKHYLNEFDASKYGELHEQNWAKSNISNCHNSMEFSISQCTTYKESRPMKSKPRTPDTYVCSRCSRDKRSPRKFSKENTMLPSPIPLQLQGLTQIEEMSMPVLFL